MSVASTLVPYITHRLFNNPRWGLSDLEFLCIYANKQALVIMIWLVIWWDFFVFFALNTKGGLGDKQFPFVSSELAWTSRKFLRVLDFFFLD